MGVSRRALFALAVLSASAGLALACSSFSDSGDTLSPEADAPETAAAADADAESVDGADAGVAPGNFHTAGQSSAYFGGVAKGGMVLGQAQAPQAGPNIPLDRQWHHVRVELRQDGLVPPSFQQIASLDAKVISDTKVDLSGSGSALIQLGALVTITGLGMENALLGYDNVILRSR